MVLKEDRKHWPSKENKEDGSEGSKAKGIADNNPDTFFYPVLIAQAIVLSHKGSGRYGKTIGGHPGDGLDLRSYLLDCYGNRSKVGNDSS